MQFTPIDRTGTGFSVVNRPEATFAVVDHPGASTLVSAQTGLLGLEILGTEWMGGGVSWVTSAEFSPIEGRL